MFIKQKNKSSFFFFLPIPDDGKAARGDGIEVWAARGDPMRAGAPFGLLAQIVRAAIDLRGPRGVLAAAELGEGAALVEGCDVALRAQGVLRPERFVRVVAPEPASGRVSTS